jgi:hypothetical protein
MCRRQLPVYQSPKALHAGAGAVVCTLMGLAGDRGDQLEKLAFPPRA